MAECIPLPSNRVKTWASWKGYNSGELGEAHEDVLIVAGDISSSLERTAETLADLKERYDEVRANAPSCVLAAVRLPSNTKLLHAVAVVAGCSLSFRGQKTPGSLERCSHAAQLSSLMGPASLSLFSLSSPKSSDKGGHSRATADIRHRQNHASLFVERPPSLFSPRCAPKQTTKWGGVG